MTLALARSFFKSEMRYNHTLSIRYFVNWLEKGHFSTTDEPWDMGNATGDALTIWRDSGTSDVVATQAKVNRALDYERFSGNGSLMRIVPVGLVLWRDVTGARQVAREQGRVTHPSLACVEACEAYTQLVCGVMNGMCFLFAGLEVGVSWGLF
jgi:ADP-ribosyl-[dinitrogen reductase] hydrolase